MKKIRFIVHGDGMTGPLTSHDATSSSGRTQMIYTAPLKTPCGGFEPPTSKMLSLSRRAPYTSQPTWQLVDVMGFEPTQH